MVQEKKIERKYSEPVYERVRAMYLREMERAQEVMESPVDMLLKDAWQAAYTFTLRYAGLPAAFACAKMTRNLVRSMYGDDFHKPRIDRKDLVRAVSGTEEQFLHPTAARKIRDMMDSAAAAVYDGCKIFVLTAENPKLARKYDREVEKAFDKLGFDFRIIIEKGIIPAVAALGKRLSESILSLARGRKSRMSPGKTFIAAAALLSVLSGNPASALVPLRDNLTVRGNEIIFYDVEIREAAMNNKRILRGFDIASGHASIPFDKVIAPGESEFLHIEGTFKSIHEAMVRHLTAQDSDILLLAGIENRDYEAWTEMERCGGENDPVFAERMDAASERLAAIIAVSESVARGVASGQSFGTEPLPEKFSQEVSDLARIIYFNGKGLLPDEQLREAAVRAALSTVEMLAFQRSGPSFSMDLPDIQPAIGQIESENLDEFAGMMVERIPESMMFEIHMNHLKYIEEATPDELGVTPEEKDGMLRAKILTISNLMDRSLPKEILEVAGDPGKTGEKNSREAISGAIRTIFSELPEIGTAAAQLAGQDSPALETAGPEPRKQKKMEEEFLPGKMTAFFPGQKSDLKDTHSR